MSTPLLNVIFHYQRSIEKSVNDEKRLLHCIEKLYRLPVKLEHLQTTGVGKTVNSLRKYDREVGIAAKALVAKWKAMVAAETEDEEREEVKKTNDEDNEDEHQTRNDKSLRDNDNQLEYEYHNDEEKSAKHNGHHMSSHNRDRISIDSSNKSRSHEHRSRSSNNLKKSRSNSKSRYNTSDKHKKEDKKYNRHNSLGKVGEESENKIDDGGNSINASNEDLKPIFNDSSEDHVHLNLDEIDEDEDEEKLIIDVTKEKVEDRESKSQCENKVSSKPQHHHSPKQQEDKIGKRKKELEEKESSKSKKSKHNESKKDSKNRQKEEDIEKRKESNSSHKSNSEQQHKNSYREKSQEYCKEKDYKQKEKSKYKEKERKRERYDESTKKHERNKRKHSETDSRTFDTSSLKAKVPKVQDHEMNNSIRNSFEDISGTPQTPTTSSKCKITKSTSSSSNSSLTPFVKPSPSRASSKSKTPPLLSSNIKLEPLDSTYGLELSTISPSSKGNSTDRECNYMGEIDSSMGTSFEDALGMISAPPSNKNSSKAKSTKINSSCNSSNTMRKLSPPSCDNLKSKTPPLLSSHTKLEPLDPTIALDLPVISPNYKPLPLNPTVMECVFSSNNKPQKRMLTDEEALSAGISSKTIRTKVYSGMKTGALIQVPNLFDMCIRVLQKHIDALEYTGGVPFEVLKPVLERATPQQLLTFEEFNPYLMDDSDVLWKQHCARFYRGQKRCEMETWREMFFRCKEEQEHRLSILAENIKQSQKQISLPVKKTQLAYVDTIVKPPRNVQRKQEQFGTKLTLAATPAARVAALSSIAPNAAKAGDARLRVLSDRDNAQAINNIKPKKAPLMQKSLQLLKGRFKR